MSWKDFYSGTHVGDPWGQTSPTDAFHFGQDYKGWAAGTKIPAPCAGVVVKSGWNFYYGWYVTWRCEHDRLCGRAHLSKKGLAKGRRFNTGDTIGLLGSSGRWARGPHTHAYEGTGFEPGTGVRRNPAPHINAQFASSIPAGETITPLPAMKDIDMFVIRAKNYYLVGIDQAHKIDAGEAAAWQSQLGGGKVAAVSSERARLLITAAARNGNKSAAQIAALTQGETGVSEADAQKIANATAEEIGTRLVNG